MSNQNFNSMNVDAETIRNINTAVALAEQNNTPEQLKKLLKGLLLVIGSLSETVQSLQKKTDISDSFVKTSTEVSSTATNMILEVQDYLNTNYRDIFIKKRTLEEETQLKEAIRNYVLEHNLFFPNLTSSETAESIIKSVLGWDVIDELMDETNDDVEEISIDDFNDITVISGGKRHKINTSFHSPEHLKMFTERLIVQASKDQKASAGLSDKRPFIRVRLGNSTRVSIMGGGIARRNPGVFAGDTIHLCIRKQKSKPLTVEKLISFGSINAYGALLMRLAISHGVSVCAFGETNSGKTASLRAFFEYIPDNLKVITMAETDEMNLRKLDMREFIEDPKNPGVEIRNPRYKKSINSVLMWEFANMTQEIMPGKAGFIGGVNASLTFSPDFIILQESKGGEIKDVIEEAISGHQVATTIHVNDSKNVPMRILLMYQQSESNISSELILQQVPAAFPLIVKFKRYRDGSRKMAEISELTGFRANGVVMEAIVKPLLIYEVNKTVEVGGKLKVEGQFHAVFNPAEGRVFKIMKENGLTEAEETELINSYNSIKPSSAELAKYQQMYG